MYLPECVFLLTFSSRLSAGNALIESQVCGVQIPVPPPIKSISLVQNDVVQMWYKTAFTMFYFGM